jgi:hypothetical protein
MDLINGNWSGQRGQWSFRDDGTAQLVERQASGAYGYQAYRWEVRAHGADPILYLHAENRPTSERFFIEQTCDGVSLTNVEDLSPLGLEYHGEATGERMIIGHWENGLDKDQLQLLLPHLRGDNSLLRAKLSFDFDANGTFVQKIFSHEKGLLDQTRGNWVISKDGTYLLLEDLKGRRCIPIQYLQLDELVLRQVFPLRGEEAPSRAMYFNKL